MLDRIFAAISMLGVIAFVSVVMWFVREPDLIIVSVIVICIGVYYIWSDLAAGDGQGGNKARNGNSDG